MHPILFTFGPFHVGGSSLGPIQVHSFSVMLILAFLGGLWLARRRAPKFGFEPGKVSDVSMVVLFAGVLGARVLFILQELPYYLQHKDQLFSLQFQGLTSFGALLFGVGVYAWFAWKQKRPFRDVLDMVAPSALLGHAIGRIGCLLNGCCYGVVTTSKIGVHIDDSNILHVPAQLFDSLMAFAAVGILLAIEKRGLHRGQSFSLFLILYGGTRFIYEFWRAGTVEQVNAGIASSTYWGNLPITQAQAVAALMVVSGAVMFMVWQRQTAPQQEIATA
jgi:phosphatidylglycerol:prolipoprotein diacylglycerol transferase